MTQKSINQRGFAALEAFLILIIVAIIGGTGYYIYHANSKATDTQNAAQTDANTAVSHTSNDTAAQKFVTIKEWNVRAPYNGKLTLESSVSGNVASFSSSELDASGTQCKSEANFGGSIIRYQATDAYLNEDGSDSGKTAAQYAATLKSPTYGRVGTEYYFYTAPQAACGDTQSSKDLQAQTKGAVEGLMSKLQAVPTAD